jgi:translation initiation factor 3 subunit J
LQSKCHDDFGMLQQKLREEAERKVEVREVREVREVKQELTAEEILAEKMLQQKLQEESDLRVAMETFGVFDSLFLDLIHICKH